MIIADLNEIEGRTYPAKRRTQNLVGGLSPIQCNNFCIGNVTLGPEGGQVPWHNQEQEEVYFVVEGTGEMCLGEERRTAIINTGQELALPLLSSSLTTILAFMPLFHVGSMATWGHQSGCEGDGPACLCK